MDLGYLFSEDEQLLLLFGGPYSNLNALLALQKIANQLAIAPDHIICTGDIVAYCGQPSETVDAIRDWGIHVLMGNCEQSFANQANDCGCGFDEGSSCDLLSVEWFDFANTQLNQDQRQWFAQLPRTMHFYFFERKCQVVHGSVTSINQFIFASASNDAFSKQLSYTDADIVIAGHSGIPFSKTFGNRLWHNAGAIGMPANDGTQHTWYSIISAKQGYIKIETLPLQYDAAGAATAMREAGLDNGYAKALESGFWPSMDVLPEVEQGKQGQALEFAPVYF
ncbi:MAG: metallophosphoesterase family protein [Pseudomonadota bacterium]